MCCHPLDEVGSCEKFVHIPSLSAQSAPDTRARGSDALELCNDLKKVCVRVLFRWPYDYITAGTAACGGTKTKVSRGFLNTYHFPTLLQVRIMSCLALLASWPRGGFL